MDIVTVTATLDDWYPGAKIRLVIWEIAAHSSIANKYFEKPSSGDTVEWKLDPNIFSSTGSVDFNAQIEFGTLHAEYEFTFAS